MVCAPVISSQGQGWRPCRCSRVSTQQAHTDTRTHMHTQLHTHTSTHVHTDTPYTHTQLHTHTQTHPHTTTYTHTHIHMHTDTYTHAHTSTYNYTRAHTCTWAHKALSQACTHTYSPQVLCGPWESRRVIQAVELSWPQCLLTLARFSMPASLSRGRMTCIAGVASI